MSDIEAGTMQPQPEAHRRLWGFFAATGLALTAAVGGAILEASPAQAETSSVSAGCNEAGKVAITGTLVNDTQHTLSFFRVGAGVDGQGYSSPKVDVPAGETRSTSFVLSSSSTPGGTANIGYSDLVSGIDYQIKSDWGAVDCDSEPSTTTTTEAPSTTTTTEAPSTTTTTEAPSTTTGPTTAPSPGNAPSATPVSGNANFTG